MAYNPYIYILGIGGIGMSALARWYVQQGITVWGHDKACSPITQELQAEGVFVHFEESPTAIPRTILNNPQRTLVIYSPSILPTHPIRAYLAANLYALCKRADIIDDMTAQYETWAVAGTHGKTTTTCILAHILKEAQQPIYAFLGGIAKNYGTNFISYNSHHPNTTIVIEADEYDRFFLRLHPNLIVITTVDPDHLEIYGNQKEFEEAFRQFLSKLPPNGLAILHRAVAEKLFYNFTIQPPLLCYALEAAPIHAKNIHIGPAGEFIFDYVSPEVTIKHIHLSMPGYHNIENTLAAITACLYRNIAPNTIREAIHSFQGVARRFDVVLEENGFVLIDDYGHHPVEIAALLKTVRVLYPNKKITVIFQPNQYSRTKDFLTEFGKSLSLADALLVSDIYSDREKAIEGIDASAILTHVTLANKYNCTNENLISTLAQVTPLEVIVNVGAGNADSFIEPIKEFLRSR